LNPHPHLVLHERPQRDALRFRESGFVREDLGVERAGVGVREEEGLGAKRE
jgi:hypothetical protein